MEGGGVGGEGSNLMTLSSLVSSTADSRVSWSIKTLIAHNHRDWMKTPDQINNQNICKYKTGFYSVLLQNL